MAAPARRARVDGLSIGQVIERLRGDFPQLSPSKLRFLEEQGIVRPTRSANGYRTFSAHDVHRLGIALALQRDHFLPLREIRAHLDALDAGDAREFPVAPATRMTRADLIATAGASTELLDAAVEAGLLTGAAVFSRDAATLLTALVDLARVGIAPRHLRDVQLSVAREVDVVTRALAPRRRAEPTNHERLREEALAVAERIDTVRRLIRARAFDATG